MARSTRARARRGSRPPRALRCGEWLPLSCQPGAGALPLQVAAWLDSGHGPDGDGQPGLADARLAGQAEGPCVQTRSGGATISVACSTSMAVTRGSRRRSPRTRARLPGPRHRPSLLLQARLSTTRAGYLRRPCTGRRSSAIHLRGPLNRAPDTHACLALHPGRTRDDKPYDLATGILGDLNQSCFFKSPQDQVDSSAQRDNHVVLLARADCCANPCRNKRGTNARNCPDVHAMPPERRHIPTA